MTARAPTNLPAAACRTAPSSTEGRAPLSLANCCENPFSHPVKRPRRARCNRTHKAGRAGQAQCNLPIQDEPPPAGVALLHLPYMAYVRGSCRTRPFRTIVANVRLPRSPHARWRRGIMPIQHGGASFSGRCREGDRTQALRGIRRGGRWDRLAARRGEQG